MYKGRLKKGRGTGILLQLTRGMKISNTNFKILLPTSDFRLQTSDLRLLTSDIYFLKP